MSNSPEFSGCMRRMYGAHRLVAALFALLACVFATVAAAQNINDGYRPILGDYDVVRSVVLQPDGMALVGGKFPAISGKPCKNVCRLRVDGEVDPGFGMPAVDGAVHAIVRQSDGKILIGGEFTKVGAYDRGRLARLLPNGNVDLAFPDPAVNGTVWSLHTQTDGSILVGGDFTQIRGVTRERVARLQSDGSLDASFGNPGVNDAVHTLIPLADGHIAVGGMFSSVGGQPRARLARLNADGSMDATFTADVNATVYALQVQSDGKLLVGGDFVSIAGVSRQRLARLLPDGSLDAGFASLQIDDAIYGLALQGDGKIVVSGVFEYVAGQRQQAVVRLNTDGSVDHGFPNPDIVAGTSSPDEGIHALAIQEDGRILIGGWFEMVRGDMQPNLARLHTDGRHDRTAQFDTFLSPDPSNLVRGMALQADGKVLVARDDDAPGPRPRRLLMRMNQDGTEDTALILPLLATVAETAEAVAVQPDGLILVAGAFVDHSLGFPVKRLMRIAPDGSIDPGFHLPDINGGVSSIALQADGKILISGGFWQIDGHLRRYLARLNTDGSLDHGFADTNPDIEGGYGGLASLLVQNDGKIMVAGPFESIAGHSSIGVARLNPDGSFDDGFASPWTEPLQDPDEAIMALAAQPDGKILVGGSLPGGHGLVRLQADGSFDSSFIRTLDGAVDALALQADGAIIAGGNFDSWGGSPHEHLARIMPNGMIDEGFAAVGIASFFPYISNLALQSDGKLLVGGMFTSIGGAPRNGFARLSLPTAAGQSFELVAGTATWRRSGTSPELSTAPVLEHSTDGVTFNRLGTMARVAGGWAFADVPEVPGAHAWYRVRGTTTGGGRMGSQGLIERIFQVWTPPQGAGSGDAIFRDGFESDVMP